VTSRAVQEEQTYKGSTLLYITPWAGQASDQREPPRSGGPLAPKSDWTNSFLVQRTGSSVGRGDLSPLHLQPRQSNSVTGDYEESQQRARGYSVGDDHLGISLAKGRGPVTLAYASLCERRSAPEHGLSLGHPVAKSGCHATPKATPQRAHSVTPYST
jgi:hypothetical protein